MTPDCKYAVMKWRGEHLVVFWRPDRPDWFRVLARFRDKDRAEQYAEIEQECRDDDPDWPDRADEAETPPADPEPFSVVKSENFRPSPRYLPAPDARKSRATDDAPAEAPTAPDPAPQPPTPDEAETPALPQRAASPTRRVVFAELKRALEAGEHPSGTSIGNAVGLSQVGASYHLNALVRAGRVRQSGAGRGTRYEIIGDPPDPTPVQVEKPQPKRRFAEHFNIEPERVSGLPADHPAVTEGRTLFPTTVVDAADSPRLLVSGANQRKIGDRVTKGPWQGFPIFCLSLEERATCPESCHHWTTCYGNGMQLARRHRHGPELEDRLAEELWTKQVEHPKGFVVRLHILGDFYSVGYVRLWGRWLEKFPALHVFGYSAWEADTPIGDAIDKLRADWDRFAIRRSAAAPLPRGATTIWRKAEGPKVPEGIVCPAQTDATACCGSCGLCWSPACAEETIVFMAHGRAFQPSGKRPEVEAA